jgi:hypothetical protein
MGQPKKTTRATALARDGGFSQDVANVTSRQAQTRLELPAGEPDIEGLRAVTREWLVPALVEKFLREHGIQPRSPRRGESE